MSESRFLCFAHGQDNLWEAICVDLDIAVTGRSLQEVKDLLETAVFSYVADAKKENPAARDKLLSRASPVTVKISFLARVILSSAIQMFLTKTRRNDFDARFTILCHA
jgi:hypothetical protein